MFEDWHFIVCLLDWVIKPVKEIKCHYYPYAVCIFLFFRLNLPRQWRMTSSISLNCWILHRLTLLLSDLKTLWMPYLSLLCLLITISHPFIYLQYANSYFLVIFIGRESCASWMLLLTSLWICTILFRPDCLVLLWVLIFLLWERKA